MESISPHIRNVYDERGRLAFEVEHKAVVSALQDESEFGGELTSSLLCSDKPRVLFLAGHFPLLYNEQGAYAGSKAWGDFTLYTFDLGCENAKLAQQIGKEPRIILLADDINYEDHGQNSRFKRHWKARKRDAFYRNMSTPEAQLPEEFQEIMSKHGLPLDVVLRQNQNKKGRASSLIFSERSLRSNRSDIQNECAKSYTGLIESHYFDKRKDYLVAFIPDHCTGNVCQRVLDSRRDPEFYGSHFSMQTDSTLLASTDRNAIWRDWGVKMRRDGDFIRKLYFHFD